MQDPPRSAPPPAFFSRPHSCKVASKEKSNIKKNQSYSHNGRHPVNNHNACVLNANYVSHQRRHYKAGNRSLLSRSFQCLCTIHGRPAFQLSRQRSTSPTLSLLESTHPAQSRQNTRTVRLPRALRGRVEYHLSFGRRASCTCLPDQVSCFLV